MKKNTITTNMYEFILLIIIVLCIIGVCIKGAYSADNTLIIDQSGSGNNISVIQDGLGHSATVLMGATLASDNNTISIEQRDYGIKTSTIQIPNGINNGVSILQAGTGNHTAAITNLNGSGNSIAIDQSGAGSHQFNVISSTGTTNNGNTIAGQQSGGSGADKYFSLNLNGTAGSSVNVQQTNPTQANTGSLSIQCSSGSCGSYSYIRN